MTLHLEGMQLQSNHYSPLDKILLFITRRNRVLLLQELLFFFLGRNSAKYSHVLGGPELFILFYFLILCFKEAS